MILVTGGTGFIGQALVRQLVEAGYPVRTLIRPSRHSPNLPRGVPVEVAVSSLTDERSLRAAMVGIDTVYHLISGEWRGAHTSLMEIDIQGTQTVARAAAEARVDRIFYISHLGADRASAYPVLKAKAIAEEHLRRSGVGYTIFRSGIVFGPNDRFTTGLAQILQTVPFFFLMPGDGNVLLQPLWVEDLVACLVWALQDNNLINQTVEVGGPEFLPLSQIVREVMVASGTQRSLIPMRPPYMRYLTMFLEQLLPVSPVSVYWLDYLASNHTCSVDSLPRQFNLMPARFSQRLAYLRGRIWRISIARSLMRKRIAGQ
jgi:NADH dehydrogenase